LDMIVTPTIFYNYGQKSALKNINFKESEIKLNKKETI